MPVQKMCNLGGEIVLCHLDWLQKQTLLTKERQQGSARETQSPAPTLRPLKRRHHISGERFIHFGSLVQLSIYSSILACLHLVNH